MLIEIRSILRKLETPDLSTSFDDQHAKLEVVYHQYRSMGGKHEQTEIKIKKFLPEVLSADNEKENLLEKERKVFESKKEDLLVERRNKFYLEAFKFLHFQLSTVQQPVLQMQLWRQCRKLQSCVYPSDDVVSSMVDRDTFPPSDLRTDNLHLTPDEDRGFAVSMLMSIFKHLKFDSQDQDSVAKPKLGRGAAFYTSNDSSLYKNRVIWLLIKNRIVPLSY